MNKEQVIEELKKLNVEIPEGATSKELKALLAANTPEEPKEEKKVKDSVDVVDKEGNYIRTYNEELHGDDFKDLANTFAGKVEGRSVVPTK